MSLLWKSIIEQDNDYVLQAENEEELNIENDYIELAEDDYVEIGENDYVEVDSTNNKKTVKELQIFTYLTSSILIDNQSPMLANFFVQAEGILNIIFNEAMKHDQTLQFEKIVLNLDNDYNPLTLNNENFIWQEDNQLNIELSSNQQDYNKIITGLEILEGSGLTDLYGNVLLYTGMVQNDGFLPFEPEIEIKEIIEEDVDEIIEEQEKEPVVVFDPEAKHSCQVEPFSQKIKRGNSGKAKIKLSASDDNKNFKLLTGEISQGLEILFDQESGQGSQDISLRGGGAC